MFSTRLILFCVLLALASSYGVHGNDCVTKDEMKVYMKAYIDRIAKLEEIVKAQDIEIRQQQDTLGKGHTRKRQVEQPVALTATINEMYVDHVGVGQTIVFPDVITNIGASYHSQHGIFTVPISGLYLVSTTLLTARGKLLTATIEVNGHHVVRLHEMGTGTDYGSTSQTIVLQLNKGDDLAVQSLGSDAIFWGDKYCSFTVVLLHEIDTVPTVVG